MKKPRKILRTIAVLFLMLTVVIVYRSYVYHPEQVGKVIDSTTGEPISGAIVVQATTGHNLIVMSVSYSCINAVAAVSDEAGNYKVPSWSRFSYKLAADKRYTYRTRVYKAGYEFDMLTGDTIYMKPFVGSKIERAKQLYYKLYICKTGDRASKLEVSALFRAMLSEAREISGNSLGSRIGDSKSYTGKDEDMRTRLKIGKLTYNAMRRAETGKMDVE